MNISNGAQKKFLIITITVLLLVAIAAAAIYVVKQKPNRAALKPEATITVEDKKFLNYTGGSGCDSLTDEAKKKECFSALNAAMNSTSADACAGLASEQDKLVCQKAVFIQEVAVSGDLTKCDEITDETNKTICISQASLSLAISKQDKKYCDNLTYPDDKAYCLKTLSAMNATGTTTPSGKK